MKKWFDEQESEVQVRMVVSALVAIVCSVSMIASGGATGIGWFIFLMWIIW